MKSFKQYITEARPVFVKGWTFKSKIVTSTTEYNNYHIKQVIEQPTKFGMTRAKIIKVFADAYKDSPEDYPEGLYDMILDGEVDNDVYLEEYLQKKGYCMFVVDKVHGSVQGWDEKSTKLGAKAIDDKYLPFEKEGFKLLELKPVRGRPKYMNSKYEWYDWLKGKKAKKYVSPMAQFREAVEYVIWGIPPKEKDETLLLTTGTDGKRITKKSDARKLLKLLVDKHGVKKARIQELDVEVDPSDMFRNPFG